jgi:t-SNARE complex subunit (syntaxin)
MQTMVELQQEALTDIEKLASNTNYELEQGHKHVGVAIKVAKMTRKVRNSIKTL